MTPDRRRPDTVLVVENSRAFAEMLAAAVRDRLGLPVAMASSLGAARDRLDAGERFLLVVTGLVLPDAREEEIIDLFAKRGQPVAVVTGVHDDAVRDKVLARPVVDYVPKNAPGAVDSLVALVDRTRRNRGKTALVVDDCRTMRAETAAVLRLAGFHVAEAADGVEALAVFEADPSIRLVVTDYAMPRMDGIELVRQLRSRKAADCLSIIGFSGSQANSSLVARFLKNGANDFLHTPFSREEFLCRVSQNMDNLDMIASLREAATRDFLTGLANRRHFFDHVAPLLAAPAPVVAMLDIDHFKPINDRWGHDGGDTVLKAVATALTALVGPADLLARFGGEEFCIASPALPATGAGPYFERIRAAMAGLEVAFRGNRIPITASIGVCVGLRPGGIDAMLTEADHMLYASKSGGRDRVTLSLP